MFRFVVTRLSDTSRSFVLSTLPYGSLRSYRRGLNVIGIDRVRREAVTSQIYLRGESKRIDEIALSDIFVCHLSILGFFHLSSK